jgi:hypothetical protein
VGTLALLAGLTAGRMIAPVRATLPSAGVTAAAAAGTPDQGHAIGGMSGPGPARWQAGVPLGWAPTRAGAVAAAAAYARTLSAMWFLADAAKRHAAVALLAVPEVTARLQANQDALAASVAAGPFGAGLQRPGVTSVLRTTLLGYRVDRFSGQDATVALWAVVVYGNDGGLTTQAVWSTAMVRLRWVRGDWKLQDATTAPGPVPVQGQDTPSAAADLVREAATFTEFTVAPRT